MPMTRQTCAGEPAELDVASYSEVIQLAAQQRLRDGAQQQAPNSCHSYKAEQQQQLGFQQQSGCQPQFGHLDGSHQAQQQLQAPDQAGSMQQASLPCTVHHSSGSTQLPQVQAAANNHDSPTRAPSLSSLASSSSNISSSSAAAAGESCSQASSGSGSCSGTTNSTTTSSSNSSSSNIVVVTVLDGPSSETEGVTSIYDLYTPRKMYCIMIVVALAALSAPLSNTIFFPAMKAIQLDLHTSAAALTTSVASFQVAIGFGALLWGPASDKYGRKPVLVIATALFALTNVPLILASNIAVLLAFRTLQGAAVAAYASAGPGMVADICSPANRGTLFGVCSVAALLGPVIGPPLGGGLAQAFGWRSMFVLLAGLSSLVILPLLLWFVPETLQYKVMQRFSSQQPAAACKIAEAETILGQGSPKFQAPWWPLRIALDPSLILHVTVILLGYGTYICSLAVLPFYLSRPPYFLKTGAIGAVYLPGAIAAIVASPCGGKLADLAAKANPQQPLRRLVYANLLGMPLVPSSILLLGWGLQKGLPLALPMVALLVASFVNCLYMPALFTVLTIVKQEASAAAVGGVYALMFLLSGSFMAVGTAVITAVGLGPFLSILAVLHFSCSLAAFIQIIRSCSDTQELPEPLISRHGSAAFMRSAYKVVSTSFKGPEDTGLPAGPAQQGAGKDLEALGQIVGRDQT